MFGHPASRFGVADVNGTFTSQDILPTPADPAVAVKELARRIRAIVKTQPEKCFEGVGVSLPGRVDLSSHNLVFAPNLGWPLTDLKTPLERATGLDVELENAANACALAEMWFNPTQLRDLVAITVSEGIGTGIVAQGHLVSGSAAWRENSVMCRSIPTGRYAVAEAKAVGKCSPPIAPRCATISSRALRTAGLRFRTYCGSLNKTMSWPAAR